MRRAVKVDEDTTKCKGRKAFLIYSQVDACGLCSPYMAIKSEMNSMACRRQGLCLCSFLEAYHKPGGYSSTAGAITPYTERPIMVDLFDVGYSETSQVWQYSFLSNHKMEDSIGNQRELEKSIYKISSLLILRSDWVASRLGIQQLANARRTRHSPCSLHFTFSISFSPFHFFHFIQPIPLPPIYLLHFTQPISPPPLHSINLTHSITLNLFHSLDIARYYYCFSLTPFHWPHLTSFVALMSSNAQIEEILLRITETARQLRASDMTYSDQKLLKNRLHIVWGEEGETGPATSIWRKRRARQVYSEIQKASDHLLLPAILAITPTQCTRKAIENVLGHLLGIENYEPFHFSLSAATKNFLETIAVEQGFSGNRGYLNFIQALFSQGS